MNKWAPLIVVVLVSFLGLAGLGYFLFQDKPAPPSELLQLSTVGPKGEAPVNSDVLYLLESQVTTVRAMNLKAAVVLHDTKSDFSRVLIKGLKQEMARLNIDLVYLSDSGHDPYIERLQLISALLKLPDLLIVLPLNPADLSFHLKQASARKTSVAILNNLPDDMEHPKDYAGVVTDDLFQMGRYVAEMVAESMSGVGDVAILFYNTPSDVDRQRDQALETVLKHRYPNIKIVAREAVASSEEAQAKTIEILKNHPNVKAIYASWGPLAKGSLAGLREIENKNVKLFTIDFDKELAKDMVHGGNVGGFVVDHPFDIGLSLVRLAVLSKIGEPTPALTTVRAEKVNRQNLAIRWREIQHEEIPEEIIADKTRDDP